MILFLFLYIVSFGLCVLMAKLNKRSKDYDDTTQSVLKIVALFPMFNTFIVFFEIMCVIIHKTFNSKIMGFIKDFYNKLFD